MNKLLLSVCLSSICISANAQGTVIFSNLGQGLNAPVYRSDGVTKLTGPQFTAELLTGTSSSSLSPITTTSFLQGFGAGYFNSGIQAIPGVLPFQSAWVQVEVWNTASGATFDQALASGLPDPWRTSSVFSVQTGGGFQGPHATFLTGLGTAPVYLNTIPEPSTFSLLGMGVMVALFRMRRNWFGRSNQ